MTYRERRLVKAERLNGWAAGRDANAEASDAGAMAIIENIPLGQPILVGHHSESLARRDHARFNSGISRSIEHTAKAEEMRRKAANIVTAADRSIYSDDPDAIQRLETKLAELETKRDRIKAYNGTVKGESKDLTILSADELKDLLSYRSAHVNDFDPGWKYPAYALTNISGNINRTRKHLEALRRQSQQAAPDC
jgi:Domain of unknown function (DUF3560)